MMVGNLLKLKKKKTYITAISILILVIYIYVWKIDFNNKKVSDEENRVISKTLSDGFGVNIHFVGTPIDIDLIKDAGFTVVRQDITWGNIEKEKGEFDFITTGYDELTEGLIKNGIRPYYILDYSNRLYEKNKSITTKQGQDAFAKYVEEVTSRYKNNGIIWEIWNEPNGVSWEPKPNFNEYSSLVKRVSTIIRKNDPSGIVVAPALSRLDKESMRWLEEIFKQGILEYIDAVSVHPYRAQNPETVLRDYNKLKKMIHNYTEKDIPIISGEWGYSMTKGWNGLELSEDDQAKYLVRMFLVNIEASIPISIWYDWKNTENDPSNWLHNFGIRQNDVTVSKKAYVAMNNLSYTLLGFDKHQRIKTESPEDYVVQFTNKNKESIIVFWTVGNEHEINLSLKHKEAKIITMYGEQAGTIKKGTLLTLDISDSPKYIIIKK